VIRRLSLRTQLTLLYAVPFLLSSVALLTIPLLGFKQTAPAPTSLAPPHNESQGVDLRGLLTVYAFGLALVAVLSIGLGWLIAGRFLRPLRTITATARDISATNLHRRLALHASHEFTELADTLDDLFGRLEAAFDAQRHFVANASHELRTPLTAERALLQVALADPGATVESLRATCEDLLGLGQQQERLIEALLTLATSERGIERRTPFDLAAAAGSVLAAHRPAADRRGVGVRTSLEPAPTTGDPSLVESLLANLVENALRHNASGGWLEVSTGATPAGARVTVRNTGPVVPADQLGRLFQPFQQLGRERVRQAGGYGLGLAIVRAIAAAHGARLVPTARPGGGLDIEVTFPPPAGRG
jgi:signal transduction histidine kinase